MPDPIPHPPGSPSARPWSGGRQLAVAAAALVLMAAAGTALYAVLRKDDEFKPPEGFVVPDHTARPAGGGAGGGPGGPWVDPDQGDKDKAAPGK